MKKEAVIGILLVAGILTRVALRLRSTPEIGGDAVSATVSSYLEAQEQSLRGRQDPRSLLFQSGSMSTASAAAGATAGPGAGAPTPGSQPSVPAGTAARTWLVQFRPPLTPSLRQDIQAAAGRPITAYVPNNAFVIVAPATSIEAVKSVAGVVYVGPYPAAAKLTSSLPSTVAQWQEMLDRQRSSFRVELSPLEHNAHRELADTEATAAALQSDAAARGLAVRFRAVSTQRVSMDLTRPLRFEELQSVLRWLSECDVVHAIELGQKFRTHNYFAQEITQTGNQRPERVIWNKGIRGEGQIVGVADSGLDWNHCFFADPKFSGPNRDARKVLSYTVLPGAALGDARDGHGTHVVGSIAGDAGWLREHGGERSNAVPDIMVQFGGMAPGAKVVFAGAGAGESELPGFENVDLGDDVFGPAYRAGARVHSNSWGANANTYSSEAKSLDAFVWKHPDMLIVFAAGNDGLNAQGKITGTVGTPATAKNCLAIGASQTLAPDGWLKELDFVNWEAKRRMAEDALHESNIDCCRSDNHRVVEFCCKSFAAARVKKHPDRHGMDSMAPFSSRGPTFDGRIKPSIMAPGQFVTSSRSRGPRSPFHCKGTEDGASRSDLIAQAGTSMAAPVTTGNTLLARDYFLQGFYPSGRKNGSASLVPTAAMLTALMSAGAQPLTGFIDVNNDGHSWQRLGQIFPPLIFQGFGRVNMDTTLWFADDNPSWRLWLDQDSSVDSGQDRDYCFQLTGSDQLKLVLSWSDYPAEINVQVAQVNNLDLIAGRSEQDALAGNFVDKRDERNNVELIVFDKGQAGETFHVKIRGAHVPMGPQRYAVVVRGQFDPNSVKRDADCPAFRIAADRFQPAGEHEYFPFGPVLGGVGGGVVLLGLLCLCLRWCLRGRSGGLLPGLGGGGDRRSSG